MYKEIDIFSDLIALDLGIIHPTIVVAGKDERPGSIDEALTSMTAEESLRCRRKFRKLMRKCGRPESRKKWTPRRRRSEVMMHVRAKAWGMLDRQGISDNDE